LAATGRAARRVPPSLLALLGATFVLCIAWSLVTPAFQAPDENSHFGYTQELAEDFDLPGDPARPAISREQILAASNSNADQAAAVRATKMEWSRSAYDHWRSVEARLPRSARTDGGGPNPASSNPPLYYLLEAGAYRVAEGGDIFVRLEMARLLSLLWALVTVTAVWLLAGEVFARDRLLQLAAAGAAALAPMLQFISASVSPDSMLYAVWSLALWVGVRILKRGLTTRSAFTLFAIVGAGCAVKTTTYALLPGALLVLAIGLWRRRPLTLRDIGRPAGAAACAMAATVGVWFALARLMDRAATAQLSDATGTAGTSVRELLSYVWQFYLPRLPFQAPFTTGAAPTIPIYDIWLKGAWASFGWLEVQFAGPVYIGLAIVTVLVAVLAGLSLWRYRHTSDIAVGAFFAVVTLTLLAALHWTEYHVVKAGAGNFNQGRYLLPLIGLAGLAVAQMLRPLSSHGRAMGVAVVLGGLFTLDLCSLALTMERFYA
jgi:4-amino-4-deoxy-L-arabinose transferase-like glycosyltransferase